MRDIFEKKKSPFYHYGLLIKTVSGYEIDDPLFRKWLMNRRMT